MQLKRLRLGLLFAVSFLYIVTSPTYGQATKASMASHFFSKKEYQKVIEMLSPKVETLQRDDLILLGKSYSFSKNHLSAVKIYQSIVSQNSKDFEALTLLGGEQFLINKNSEALSNLKEALLVNPKFRLAYSLLIQHYQSQPKINRYELRLLYEDLIANFGESEEGIVKLCDLTANDRLYDLAFKYCQKGIQDYPKCSECYINLGQSYHDTGDKEKAEETLKKAATIFSKSDRVQLAYAKYLEDQKNFTASYSYFKKAASLNGVSLDALVGQASTALELQKFAEALTLFDSNCRKDKLALSAYRKALTSLRAQKNNPEVKPWITKFEVSLAKCENF